MNLHNARIFDTGGRHRPSHVHLPSIGQVRTLIDLGHHVFADGKTETRFLERDAITDVGGNCQTLAANELKTKVGVDLTLYQCLTFCSLEDANLKPPFGCLQSPVRADHLITLAGALHFGPLGPTPFRDGRWTFPLRGFAADCL